MPAARAMVRAGATPPTTPILGLESSGIMTSHTSPSPPLRFALSAVTALAIVADARAFDSYGAITAEHGQLTEQAGQDRGFNAKAISVLQDNNRGVDWEDTETKAGFPPYLGATNKYGYWHHFDRGKDGDNFRSVQTTFSGSRDYVVDLISTARTQADNGKPNDALATVGKALHAVQDLASHSNIIDLGAADQAKVLTALFDTNAFPPAGMLLTSYVTTSETENPKNDPLTFTHGKFAKDAANKNAESKLKPGGGAKTKFQIAMELGRSSSNEVLKRFVNGLANGDAVKQLAAIDSLPGDEKYKFIASAEFTPGSPFQVSGGGTTLSFDGSVLASPALIEVRGAPLDVFNDTDQLLAPDGRFMGILREVDPRDALLNSTGRMEINFSLSEIDFLIPATLQAYYLDPIEGTWLYAQNALLSVNTMGGSGFAALDVPITGVYAIGGFAVPEPAIAMILAGIVPLPVAYRRRRK